MRRAGGRREPARGGLLAALLSALPLPLLAQGTGIPQRSYAECERSAETTAELARCIHRVAHRDGSFAEAARRLELLRALDPGDPDVLRWLAEVEADRAGGHAEELLAAAAEAFAAAGRPADEVEARAALSRRLISRGDRDAAREQLEAARRVLGRTDSIDARGWLELAEAHLASSRGDHGAARQLLDAVEADILPRASPVLRAAWRVAAGANAWYLGEYERSEGLYVEAAELWADSGDRFSEAMARTTLLLFVGQDPVTRAERALAIATEGGNLRQAARCHSFLADLLPEDRPAEKLDHAERAVALSRAARDPAGLQMALRGHASTLLATDPERALEVLAEAIDTARRSGDPAQMARNRVILSRMLWRLGPRERAIAASIEALHAVEATRELQPDSEARARRFSTWWLVYVDLVAHLLAGDLLPETAAVSRDDLEAAFRVTERYRARVLLDELDASGATPALGRASSGREAWLGSQQDLSALQLRLRDPSLPASERERLLEEIEAAEREEARMRAELARAQPAFGAVRAPRLATLHEVQAALAEDQALISLWNVFDSAKSWAFVVTSSSVEICPAESHETLEPAASLYLGLVGRDEAVERLAAARLYDLLLRCPVERLPAPVRRLVVVPSWGSTQLPLGTLRPSPEAEPLVARFEITTAPSVTVWLRLRRSGAAEAGAVLALADPVLAETPVPASLPASAQNADTVARAAAPAPLPRARREGRFAAARRGDLLLVGESATERAVKRTDLDRFSVLHFATHALVDPEHPERSAIVLAPGDPDEDGLLQAREIVDLDLSGQLVVMAACRSASGELVRGEGVLGLARGFFVAGARTVVASLWPLRDDDALALLTEFYRGLRRGESVAAALAGAQAARRDEGAPAAAWAGLVVLGDGDLVPMSEDRAARRPGPWIAGALGLIAILVVASRVVRAARR
ncbi:MAG: CHAT domain-containing protein [Thermoanaerobaculia bacterium]|nr:CHAT domain-containing protein [Thermoanaerobaculia bacterium]